MKLDQSKAWLARGRKVIPSATQTFSKGPTQWVEGVSPHYLEHGEGAWVWDIDGNRFLDYMMALGPVILGYNHPTVNEAIQRQLQKGITFSQMHPMEVELAERLCDMIPCAEMVRFGKNGSDVTAGAVRAARALTGRDLIACCGYHGWQDWYIGTTTRNKGVPDAVGSLTLPFQYNHIESLERIFAQNSGQIACVIMEPMGLEFPKPNFLEYVKQRCRQEGALLIFDEVVTGLRLAPGGAQEYFDIVPDMATFGKAMGNGMPIAAVVGRREYMEIFDEIFFSFTAGGETISMVAALATMGVLDHFDAYEHFRTLGNELLTKCRNLVDRHGLSDVIRCEGYPAHWVMVFEDEDEFQSRKMRSYFMQECIKRGILFHGLHNFSLSHGRKEIDFTLNVYEQVMQLWLEAYHNNDFDQRMEGHYVESVFRKP